MYNVKLNFLSNYSLDNVIYIVVLDKKKIMYKGFINSIYEFKSEKNKVYKLYVFSNFNKSYYFTIFIKNNQTFNIKLNNFNIIKIYLFDKNYDLPITEGEIYLWQNHIQW